MAADASEGTGLKVFIPRLLLSIPKGLPLSLRALPTLMSSIMMGAMSSGGLSVQGDGPPFSSLISSSFCFLFFFFLTLSFSFSGFSCAESNSGVNPKVIYFWWHSHFFPWELLLSFTSKRQRVQFNFPSDTWITGVFQRRAGFTVRFRQFVAFLAAQTCAWCLYSHKVID